MAENHADSEAPVMTMRTTAKAAAAESNAAEISAVKVYVRVRPFNQRELDQQGTESALEPVLVPSEDQVIAVLNPDSGKSREAFRFDRVLWSVPSTQFSCPAVGFSSQEDMYNHVGQPAVHAATAGYNCTIFAYGQTGSGKTHSMLGQETDPGIAPRLIKELFAQLAEITAGTNGAVQSTVQLSFMEIYNEKVKDLLQLAKGEGTLSPPRASSASPEKEEGAHSYSECRVRYHPEYGTFVEGLIREEITTEKECQDLVRHGIEHRATSATKMNATSSRSHAIFQLCVTQKDCVRGSVKISIVNLVDLAGSERIKASGVQGKALTEAKNINLSLSTLRRVIDIMLENSSKKFNERKGIPPYRESLLTWLLSDSLGGNSRTAMLAAASPHVVNLEETIGTLRYALKAKALVCLVKVNEKKTQAVVNAIKNEVESLKTQLQQQVMTAKDSESSTALRNDLDSYEKDLEKAITEQTAIETRGKALHQQIKKHEEVLQKINNSLAPKLQIWNEAQQLHSELSQIEMLHNQQLEKAADEGKLGEQRDEEIKYHRERQASMFVKKEVLEKETEKLEEEGEDLRQQYAARVFKVATQIKKDARAWLILDAKHDVLSEREDELQEKHAHLNARMKATLQQVEEEQKRKIKLDKQHEELTKEVGDVVEHKTERIKALVAEHKVVLEELRELQTQLKAVDDELLKLEDSQAQVQKDFLVQQEAVAHERDKSLEKSRELSKEEASLQQQLDSVNEEIKGYERTNATLDEVHQGMLTQHQNILQGIHHMKGQIAMNEKETMKHVEAKQECESKMEKYRNNAAEFSSEQKNLKSSDQQLKGYVKEKYFPEKARPVCAPKTATLQNRHALTSTVLIQRRGRVISGKK